MRDIGSIHIIQFFLQSTHFILTIPRFCSSKQAIAKLGPLNDEMIIISDVSTILSLICYFVGPTFKKMEPA